MTEIIRTSLIFLHIPKTAGTSLRAILASHLGPNGVSAPFRANVVTGQQANDLKEYDVICGHISRADQIRWFPERRVITMLREPIDRCLSWITYARALPPSPFSNEARVLPIEEFILKNQKNLLNRMVRQLGGDMNSEPSDFQALFQNAKTTLREAVWIGQQENFANNVASLGQLMPMIQGELRMTRDNVTPIRPRYNDLGPAVMAQLQSMNEYDYKLWLWARRHLSA